MLVYVYMFNGMWGNKCLILYVKKVINLVLEGDKVITPNF